MTSASVSNGPAGFSGSASFGPPPPAGMRAQTGAPYSGEEVTEQVQTLADGTHITQKGAPTKVYRDSVGRTRTERPLFRGIALAGRVPDSPIVVEITDPVAQVKYTLDPVNHVAHRQQFQAPRVLQAPPPPPPGQSAARAVLPSTGGGVSGVGGGFSGASVVSNGPASGQMARPQMTNEKLGTQTIEGVLAEGTRHTTTWPIDSQGNDRPISVVSETWTGVDLKGVLILNTTNDPRRGQNTQKLTNISLAEPDASLFQPPADYSVVDETGNFSINWGQRK